MEKKYRPYWCHCQNCGHALVIDIIDKIQRNECVLCEKKDSLVIDREYEFSGLPPQRRIEGRVEQ